MTVIEKSSRKLITGSGWANPLTHNFELEATTHLKVYADTTLLTLGVDYSISGILNPDGYSVTITNPSGWTPTTWVLLVEPPINQPADVSLGGVFGARFEDGLDFLARRVQSLAEKVSRSLKSQVNTTVGVEYTLPPLADGKFIGWNGTGLENKAALDLGTETLPATASTVLARNAGNTAFVAKTLGATGESLIAAATPSAANSIVVGQTNINMDVRFGTSEAAIKAGLTSLISAPGTRLHFGPGYTPFAARLDVVGDWDIEWHGRTFYGTNSAATGDAADLIWIDIPPENTRSGDVRMMKWEGLRAYWANVAHGRNTLWFKRASAQCQFERFNLRSGGGDGGLSGNPYFSPSVNDNTGFAFKIGNSAIDNHWNILRDSFLSGKGVGHFGADGWKFDNVGFAGTCAMYFSLFIGAFETVIQNCTGSMSELAWVIENAAHMRFINCSWEQSGVNTGQYNAQAVILPGSDGVYDIVIEDSFGGGGNVGTPLLLYQGTTGAYDVVVGRKAIFNKGSTGFDIDIVQAGVIGFRNEGYRTRGAVTDNNQPWLGRINDNGTESMGVVDTVPLTLNGPAGWAHNGARVVVDPFTLKLRADGLLNSGTLTAGTLVGTLKQGRRPRIACSRLTAGGRFNIATNGQITIGAVNYVGANVSLTELLDGLPVVARTTYNDGP